MKGVNDTKGIRKPKRRRPPDLDGSNADSSRPVALWIILGMVIIGISCLLYGCIRHGAEWRTLLSAVVSLVTGVGFVAIGTLELEWLERIIGFVGGIISGISQYFWSSEVGSVSDFFGRRQAMVLWCLFGFPIFVWGCLVSLRIV